jgi:predicted DNA-binding protein
LKKDLTYSMRMSRRMQEALKMAAEQDRRSVASLLDKIISDYLEKEGFSIRQSFNEERRKFPRKRITLPGTTQLNTGSQAKILPSVILDVSMGGALVTYPKGSDLSFASIGEMPQFDLCFELPRSGEHVCLGCSARRISDVGNEIQVGVTFNNSSENDLQKLHDYLI